MEIRDCIPKEQQRVGRPVRGSAFLDKLADSVPATLAFVDAQECNHFNNELYRSWFGRSLTGNTGEVVAGSLNDESYRLVDDHVKAALSGQTVTFDVLRPRQGVGARHLEVMFIPSRSPEGDVTGFFVFATDITASQQLEQKLRESELRTRRGASHAASLRRVTARFNAKLSFDEVVQSVCAETARALQVPAALLVLHEPLRAELTLGATYGLPPAFVERYRPYPMSLHERYGRRQRPFFVALDVQAEPELPNAALYAGSGIRTIGIASLIREGRLIGALNVYSRSWPPPFTQQQIEWLRGVADQAARAIDNARIRQQASQLAVLEERARLARELHDSVTQSLYGLNWLAEAQQRLLHSGQIGDIASTLSEIGEIAQQALGEMRLLIYELRPPVLEQEGLLGALQQRLAAVEKRAGVQVQLLAGDIGTLPPAMEEALYRIAQEALNNALKHAAATSVTVSARRDDRELVLEVADNGRGFDAAEASGQHNGFGLATMRERVERLGGALVLRSSPGQGTTVSVRLSPVEVCHARDNPDSHRR